MGWADLLQTTDEFVVLPWTGGRSVRSRTRSWTLEGRKPEEYGWCKFRIDGRSCFFVEPGPAQHEHLSFWVKGFLVGDRVVVDNTRLDTDPRNILFYSERVHFLEEGLDRFVRIIAGRVHEEGPLIFSRIDMPSGAEAQVLEAFYARGTSLRGIKGVTPALEAAFRLETFHREEVDRCRAELERQRLEEELRQAREEQRQQLIRRTGSAEQRRQLAQMDFAEGARAALRIGNAEYLDHRRGRERGEMVVQFRVDGRRFECVCDAATLQIIDSGICLTDHRTGEKGDARFTLESLPGVIRQAQRERVLHVYRHVDDYEEFDD